MSYYTDTTLKVRRENAMHGLLHGAPQGTLSVAGAPIAYYVSGGLRGAPSHVVLTTYRWLPQGRCVAKAWPLAPATDLRYSESFKYQGMELHYEYATGVLLQVGAPSPASSGEADAARVEAAYRMFAGVDVDIPRKQRRGDIVEGSRRAYSKRQAGVLLRNMPEGFVLVPGCERTAYRFGTDRKGRETLTFVTPRTSASPKDGSVLRMNTQRFYGTTEVEGLRFRKVPGRPLLERDTSAEYPPEFEHFAAAVRIAERDRILAVCRALGSAGTQVAEAILDSELP